MKKILTLGVVIAAMTSFTATAASDENKITLTDNELTAVKTLIRDDIAIGFNGGNSLFDYGYLTVTAKEMFKTYSANEVRGDKTYKNKKMIISGVVDRISSSIGDIPVVSLKTGDSFSTVNVNFNRKYRDLAIDLNRNEEVSFACVGGSVVISMPSVRDCKPVDVAVEEVLEQKMKDISNTINSNEKIENKDVINLIAAGKSFGKLTNGFTTCKPDDLKCLEAEAQKLPKKSGGLKALIDSTKKELGFETLKDGE